MRFGDFVKDKRRKRKITLKVLAKELGLSVTYWSDIEHNRRKPRTDNIDELTKLLGLSTKDQDLLNDLAGKARKEVSPDLLEYIMDSEVSLFIRSALREAKQNALTVKEWKRFVQEIRRNKTKCRQESK